MLTSPNNVFAFTPQVNFPANNLNFHWRWGEGIKSRLSSEIFCTLSVLTFLLTSNFVVTFRLLIWDFAIEKILLIPPPPPTSAPNFALKNTLIQRNIAVKIGGFQSYIFVSMSQFRHFLRYTFTWKLIYNFGDHLIMRNSLVQSLKNKT